MPQYNLYLLGTRYYLVFQLYNEMEFVEFVSKYTRNVGHTNPKRYVCINFFLHFIANAETHFIAQHMF